MALLTGTDINRYFGGEDILAGLSFAIESGDRIGLVGANGCGKTTLLRVIAGLDEPNAGRLERRGDLRLGYLPQDAPELLGSTLEELMLEVFAERRRMETELADLSHRMAEPGCPADVLARYSRLHDAFEHAGGYDYHHRIDAVLDGLGFDPARHDEPLARLSGGWRTRALLARLLLEDPDLLLLDEPTNNLDLDAVRWLEDFLGRLDGSLVVVSHDRYFLDKLCGRTWELANGRLETYPGNYTRYRKLRHQRRESRQKEYDQQQEYIAREEDFIRRNLAGQRTREAQGRRRKLERFLADNAVAPPPPDDTMRFRLPPAERSGDLVVRTEGLVVGYDPAKPLATVPDLQIERGHRIAIVGPNGHGKTTLLRTILGELPALAGRVRLGSRVVTGYLSQTHDTLCPDDTLVDAIRRAQPAPNTAAARDLLGSLLFSGDDVFKQVRDVSGGQRARLAIASLCLRAPNLLFLDEPTNHLDIPTMEALQETLRDFTGTILLVSHDRYLVQAICDRLLVVEDGAARLVHATWEDYAGGRLRVEPEAPVETAAADGREAWARDKARQNERQRWQRRIQAIEQRVPDLEAEKAALEMKIGDAGERGDLAEIHRLHLRCTVVVDELTALYDEWATLAESLETP